MPAWRTGGHGNFGSTIGTVSSKQEILRVGGAWPTLTPGEIRLRLEARLLEPSEDSRLDPRTRRVYEEFMPEQIPDFSDAKSVEMEISGSRPTSSRTQTGSIGSSFPLPGSSAGMSGPPWLACIRDHRGVPHRCRTRRAGCPFCSTASSHAKSSGECPRRTPRAVTGGRPYDWYHTSEGTTLLH